MDLILNMPFCNINLLLHAILDHIRRVNLKEYGAIGSIQCGKVQSIWLAGQYKKCGQYDFKFTSENSG